jgi:hypothetical protein
MKNQFLLFSGEDYYPRGGAYDFKGSFSSEEEAMKQHDPKEHDYDGGWANIFDRAEEAIVKKFSRGTWYDGDVEMY